MKKFLVLAALTLTVATTASAQVLYKQDFGWLDKMATSEAKRIKQRTTIVTANVPDTSSAFSLLGCVLPYQGKADAASVDSTLMATVVLVTDSTVAVTNDLTVVAYKVQASEDGFNWEDVVSVSYTGITSGDKSWSIPIWVKTSDGNGTAGTKPNPFMRTRLRLIVSSATGTHRAVKPQLWYWSTNASR